MGDIALQFEMGDIALQFEMGDSLLESFPHCDNNYWGHLFATSQFQINTCNRPHWSNYSHLDDPMVLSAIYYGTDKIYEDKGQLCGKQTEQARSPGSGAAGVLRGVSISRMWRLLAPACANCETLCHVVRVRAGEMGGGQEHYNTRHRLRCTSEPYMKTADPTDCCWRKSFKRDYLFSFTPENSFMLSLRVTPLYVAILLWYPLYNP